jgi:C-terminal processing protease CtpA/Prc
MKPSTFLLSVALPSVLLLLLASCDPESSGTLGGGNNNEFIGSSEETDMLNALDAERPTGAVNQLTGHALSEYYFVYSIAQTVHPSGVALASWWEYASIDAALQVVKDEYPEIFSRYLDPVTAAAFVADWSTPAVDSLLGVVTDPGNSTAADTLEIRFVMPGSPAAQEGLMPGDKILAVGDSVLTGRADQGYLFYELLSAIPSNRAVELHLLRGYEQLIFLVNRAPVDIPTVFVEWPVPGEVALIQVTEFRSVTLQEVSNDTSGTWLEFRNALTATASAKARIIDLRGNPGGDVAICTGMADELVSESPLYIMHDWTVRLYEEGQEWSRVPATVGGLGEDLPLVFLQDSNSASCSELVLVAAQKHAVGPLVGTASYGKGIGQSLIPTPLEGMLLITSLELFGADSSRYQGVGIQPDYFVESPVEQLAKGVELAAAAGAGGAARVSAMATALDLAGLQARLQERRRSQPSQVEQGVSPVPTGWWHR